MLALQLTQTKDFMNKLLAGNSFDAFWFSEASVTTNVSFHIDGTFHPEFYDTEEAERLRSSGRKNLSWKYIKGHCFSIIRGKRPPLYLKIVFLCPPGQLKLLHSQSGSSILPEDIFGLFLNIQFDGEKLLATTGTSYRTFTLDRLLDQAWDQFIRDFMNRQEISFTEL